MFRKFLKATNGAAAFEYAIVAAMVSIAVVAGASSAGSNSGNIYDRVDAEITGAIE